jgi:hypothetical protein
MNQQWEMKVREVKESEPSREGERAAQMLVEREAHDRRRRGDTSNHFLQSFPDIKGGRRG